MPNYIGFSNLNRRLSSRYNSSYLTNLLNSNNNTISAVRVVDILLDDSDPTLFKSLGEWNGLGTIQYQTLDPRTVTFGYAKPLNSNLKRYPLVNELVYILTFPNTNIGNNPYSVNAYYISTLGLWNHPHHNGYPDTPNQLPTDQQKDYTQTELGSVRRVTDKSTEIFLGKTFVERANIHPLLPFEGDVITEGRWGNSIRLGSTVNNSFNQNNWSTVGNNGDPIVIIRNGQGFQTQEGWVPITENVKNDESSIYLTSTQQVPIEVSSNSYTSYKSSPPSLPDKYSKPQIILNSGRLVLNSYEDHILLSSIKSINLNAISSVNIDTPKTVIQSNKIYLGKNEAEEPLMLGIQTVNLLKDLVQSLTTFMTITSTATTNVCVPGLPTTLPTINSAAQDVLDDLYNLTKALGTDPNLKDCNLTSRRNYTI
jgi:hypothetical protein